jgi:FKBP-type peptidyl-prolyl cis-trans isomerase
MKHFLIFSLTAAVVAAGLQSCAKGDIVDSNAAAAENDATIKQYISQNSGTAAAPVSYSASQSQTGLYYAIVKPNPTGKKSSIGDEVLFSYVLYDLKDKILDSSKVGSLPYFTFGLNSLLPGLQEGLSYVRVGEKARLLIPSYLAFGSQAQTTFTLPANSPIRFDVELLRSRSEEDQISDYVTSTALTSSLSLTAAPTNVVKSTSGLRLIKTLSKPSGATITSGQSVTLNYTGQTLRATTPFDRSLDGTFSFASGRNQLIPGFEEGVLQLRVGEKATLIFPSSIGYGTSGAKNSSGIYVILPYAPLRFDIEVLNAK